MCGIVAIVAYRNGAPSIDREELTRIRDSMVRRGPDGAGTWISNNGRVGLAHRRLSIIDLSSAGSQPMATANGCLRIAFNGEIYNFRTLRSELEQKGYVFRSTSDTEVLLHLYAEKGPSMVHDLRGMYAFALWDEARKGLLLVRDPLGIKPLYYADDGFTLRVASQVKALIKGGHADTAPEPAGHVGFLLWGYVPEPYTLYRGIRALPAGCTLWIGQDGPQEPKRFWRLAAELGPVREPDSTVGDRAVEPLLREALSDSVRQHLVADVPVGVFLSAGLDSATVTALASEAVSGDLRTVTVGFTEYRETEHDETSLAGVVARRYGAKHRTGWVTEEGFRTEVDSLIEAMDQPSIDGVNTYFVSKVAAKAGLKVALSGLGGDELFGGYPSFRQLPAMVKMLSPFRSLSTFGSLFRLVSAPVVKHFTSPKYAGLLEYGGSYGGAYLLRRGLFMPWELSQVMDAEMVRRGWEELQPVLCLEETIEGISKDRLKVSALEMTHYMRDQLLRDADWAGMAHSLEIRVPLVDVELIRAVAPLLDLDTPPSKHDMAGVTRTPLPDAVLGRSKTGFAVPLREWLLSGDGNRPMRHGLRAWALRLYDHWIG